MPPVTPLFRPCRFFVSRDFHAMRIITVTFIIVFSLPIGIWGVGWVLQERIDGTVMIDNPNRPSQSFCEGAPTSMDMGCGAPAQIERNIDAVISEAITQVTGSAFLGVFIVILLVGGLLHVGSWMVGGENGVAASFAIALWGLVPTLFSIVLGIGLLFVFIDPMTVTPDSDPTVLRDRVLTNINSLEQWGALFSGITTLWGGLIWRCGLKHRRGLSSAAATGVAGSVVLIFWLLSLV